tara:strand:+ start:15723 stop:17159 length:1437 start_codon:yes stop_codon:yes gene_type:complete
MTPREEELARTVRDELALFAYPDREWVGPRIGADGGPMLDVLIVGGGQSGLAVAHGLRRAGISNIAVLDQAGAGREGVWENFARMNELRTPKGLFGMEQGVSALSLQHWYIGQHGRDAWEALVRVPRADWAAYLRWYRETLDLPVINHTIVRDIREGDGGLIVETLSDGAAKIFHARLVVLATGHDGAGRWAVPDFITSTLPADRFDHSNGPIDFAALKGKRVGVLGHGASAFDASVAALDAGAERVDLCFRRKRLPLVNPHRHIETAGMLTHFAELPDETRWNVARHFQLHDQPPAEAGFIAATGRDRFHMHAGAPWTDVMMEDDAIRVTTPREKFTFDHVIAATGYTVDLASRAELTSLAPVIARWRDRYAPPVDAAQEMLGDFPYLGSHYEFLSRTADADEWVSRVFAYNVSAYVSMCPHSTTISGHRYCLPRVLRGVTGRLMREEAEHVMAALGAYDNVDLVVPDHLQARTQAD